MKTRVFVRYVDDGPKGMCGQVTSITIPWDRIYIFPDYDTAYRFIRDCYEIGEGQGRKNPKIAQIWEEKSGTEVFDMTDEVSGGGNEKKGECGSRRA